MLTSVTKLSFNLTVLKNQPCNIIVTYTVLTLPFSYKHNRANQLFTSKHMACRETKGVQPALSVG
jgi:hypothetical protein